MSSMGALRGEVQSQLEALGEDPSADMGLSSHYTTCSAAGWACPYLNCYSGTVLNFLFCASHSCHRGCCQMQQELPARTNGSAPTAPALARDALHTKMEQLEEQLLSKILTLQKERLAASTDRSQQQHNIEKELNSLQNRVTELEHGESCPMAWSWGYPKVPCQESPRASHPHPSYRC